WFNHGQIYLQRNQSFQFATKGGHNDEPHNHNDLGHFILYYKGEPLLIDLGAGEYNKDYFSDKRYQFIQTSSLGHSVPVICGQQQLTGKQATAELLGSMGRKNNTFGFDLTQAYSVPTLLSYKRNFNVNELKSQLTITDQFHFSSGDQVIEESFILADLSYIEKDHQLLFFTDNTKMVIQFPEEIKDYRIKKIAYVDHFGYKQTALKLQFKCNVK